MPMIYQPPEAVDGTTAMNVAINDEVQKQNNNLIQAAREQAVLQDPSLNYAARQLRQGLLADKMDWQRAYEAGDPHGMATAALNADSHRKQAAAAGIDVSGYGSNVSLIDAAQRFANTDTKALNDIFYNLKDSGRGYTQDVADYLDQGYSIDSAKRLAEQNAQYNTQDNMNRLVDAFQMYGTDPRGAINQNGLRILGQMAQAGGASPSELANFYAQMQASPKDNWNFENSLLTAQNAQNFALDRMARSQEYNVANQDRAFAQQEKMARLNNDLGIQRMMAQAQIQIQSGVMSKEAGYNWVVQKMVEAGWDEQTARQYAATQLLGGKGSGNGTRLDSTQVKHLEEELKAAREDYSAWRDMNQDKDPSAYPGYARLQQLEAMSDSILGFKNGNGDNGPGINVNDYDEVQDYFQKLIKENDARPWDKQLTRAQLEAILINDAGDTEITRNIIQYADYDGAAKKEEAKNTPDEQPKAQPSSASNAGNTNNTTYTGQQIVVPPNVIDNWREAYESNMRASVPVSQAFRERANNMRR